MPRLRPHLAPLDPSSNPHTQQSGGEAPQTRALFGKAHQTSSIGATGSPKRRMRSRQRQHEKDIPTLSISFQTGHEQRSKLPPVFVSRPRHVQSCGPGTCTNRARLQGPAPIGTGHRDTSSGWASAQRPKNQVRTQPGQRIMGMRARCRKSWRMGGGMQSGKIIREQKNAAMRCGATGTCHPPPSPPQVQG